MKILSTMKWTRLTVLSSVAMAFVISIISCEKDSDRQSKFSKTGIVMNFAQEPPATPQTPTNASGTLDVSYTKASRTLTYTVKWENLSGNPTLMHVHGLAPRGYAAGVVQTILGAANPTTFPATGSYSGTLLVDGVVVKEENLLNGLYYVNIHTALNPVGEIRGQIVFQ